MEGRRIVAHHCIANRLGDALYRVMCDEYEELSPGDKLVRGERTLDWIAEQIEAGRSNRALYVYASRLEAPDDQSFNLTCYSKGGTILYTDVDLNYCVSRKEPETLTLNEALERVVRLDEADDYVDLDSDMVIFRFSGYYTGEFEVLTARPPGGPCRDDGLIEYTRLNRMLRCIHALHSAGKTIDFSGAFYANSYSQMSTLSIVHRPCDYNAAVVRAILAACELQLDTRHYDVYSASEYELRQFTRIFETRCLDETVLDLLNTALNQCLDPDDSEAFWPWIEQLQCNPRVMENRPRQSFCDLLASAERYIKHEQSYRGESSLHVVSRELLLVSARAVCEEPWAQRAQFSVSLDGTDAAMDGGGVSRAYCDALLDALAREPPDAPLRVTRSGLLTGTVCLSNEHDRDVALLCFVLSVALMNGVTIELDSRIARSLCAYLPCGESLVSMVARILVDGVLKDSDQVVWRCQSDLATKVTHQAAHLLCRLLSKPSEIRIKVQPAALQLEWYYAQNSEARERLLELATGSRAPLCRSIELRVRGPYGPVYDVRTSTCAQTIDITFDSDGDTDAYDASYDALDIVRILKDAPLSFAQRS